jgi:protein ImuB
MSDKLYACVISSAPTDLLKELADRFAYRIERLDDGILFGVEGLENLYGNAEKIAGLIEFSMQERGIAGNLALAAEAQAAIVQARTRKGTTVGQSLEELPLVALDLETDKMLIFQSLGLNNIGDLKKIPVEDLIARYGQELMPILDLINDSRNYLLTPNFKENYVSWFHRSDFPVLDLEQLLVMLRHGLENVFVAVHRFGLKTEEIKIVFTLEDKSDKEYQIKVSFPTLDLKFWLKIIYLKLTGDLPPSGIMTLEILAVFVRPRSIQNGLFSASAPQPESLLLTVLKIKKLVGSENVGVPVLINQRLSNAFALDAGKMPENLIVENGGQAVAGFAYFQPPLAAEVFVSNRTLVFLRTKKFQGKVKNYGGNWINSGQWWNEAEWRNEEWDVELDNGGIYRLARINKNWFILGEYD